MTALTGLVIRDLEAEDEERVRALLRLTLGAGSAPRTGEFWRWKHALSPFGASPALVALAGDEIVALRTFLRWRWQLGDRSVAAVRPVDTAVHPRWQRRGLFSRMTRSLIDTVAAEGCELAFNTPNPRSGRGYRKLGWHPVGRPPLLIRARRPLRMVAAALGVGRRRSAAKVSHYPAAAELLDRPEMPGLVRSQAKEHPQRLLTARTPGYLRWRYADVPTLDYRALWRTEADSAVAILFRSRLRRGMRELLVAEIFGRGSAKERGRLLRELADALCNDSDADYLVAGGSKSPPEKLALRRAGFRRIPRGPSLMARCLVDDPELSKRVSDNDSWQLSAGDLEIF